MKQNNVMISIQGRQNYENTDPDQLELVTEGALERQGDGFRLSYEESALTGLDGTRTEFLITPGQITLTRTGAVTSEMVFEQDRRHLSLYKTPYGNLEVGIVARRLNADLNDSGGYIEIDYDIEIDHALAGQNLFHIDVRARDGVSS